MNAEIAELSAAINAQPADAQLYHRRAWAYCRIMEWQPAQADFDRAIELDPATIRFWQDRGHLRGHLGRTGIAVSDFNHAAKLDPAEVRTYVLRGRMHHNWHESEAAIACFDRAIELEPANAAHHADRGETLAYLGELGRSLEAYGESIRLNPRAASVYWQRAYARLRYNPEVHPEDSLADLEAAIRLEPTVPFYRLNRGYLRYLRGEWTGAAADFACQDIPALYEMCKHQGAELAVWYFLAQLFAGDEAIGLQFVADYLHWYATELKPDAGSIDRSLWRWPVPAARMLVGAIDERQVQANLDEALRVADDWQRDEAEQHLLEFRFIRGELCLARGDRVQAVELLGPVSLLSPWEAMRWVAERQVARLRVELSP